MERAVRLFVSVRGFVIWQTKSKQSPDWLNTDRKRERGRDREILDFSVIKTKVNKTIKKKTTPLTVTMHRMGRRPAGLFGDVPCYSGGVLLAGGGMAAAAAATAVRGGPDGSPESATFFAQHRHPEGSLMTSDIGVGCPERSSHSPGCGSCKVAAAWTLGAGGPHAAADHSWAIPIARRYGVLGRWHQSGPVDGAVPGSVYTPVIQHHRKGVSGDPAGSFPVLLPPGVLILCSDHAPLQWLHSMKDANSSLTSR